MSLDRAIRTGDLAIAAAELRAGEDVNRRCPDGCTPLMVAAGLGQSDMVSLLLTAGGDPLAMEPQMGATALHKAAQSGNPEVIGLLLDHAAFVDHQSPILGTTPPIDAVLYKHEAAARLLLARGARTTIRNHWQQTALELAREDGSEAIAQAIEEHDAFIERQLAALPLIEAVKSGDVADAKRLIASGVDVN